MKNLLAYKLIILNVLALVWVVTTDFQSSWLRQMFFSDTTRINYGTAMLFAIVLFLSVRAGLEINGRFTFWRRYVESDHLERPSIRGDMWVKNLDWIDRAAGWMLFLGLIGTLYGLMLSLSAVNTGNLGSTEGIKQIAVQMLAGLRIELSTTVIGALAALWTEINYTLIKHDAGILADCEKLVASAEKKG